MDLLKNSKIRYSLLIILALAQLPSLMNSKFYSDYLFFTLNCCYFILGFLSIDWKQAIKNITLVTIPIFIFFSILLLIMPIFNGKSFDITSNLSVTFQLWGLILVLALPLFVLGFGARGLAYYIFLKTRKKK